MEVADQGDVTAEVIEVFTYLGNGSGGSIVIDGYPHQLATGVGQRPDLGHCSLDVGGVGVGHGLNDDRVIAADQYVPYPGYFGRAPFHQPTRLR